MNLTEKLGNLLVKAAKNHYAPNVPQEEAYDLLATAGVDESEAAMLADCMYELAQFITPPEEKGETHGVQSNH